ncbi:MAG: hypothetical protein M3024_08275 [Candidatus Dormibacteraeota bacterium]|nr:hypothetical protein [Candidatus Dormibacteraeota bacterium]
MADQATGPNLDLRALDRLVGTWSVSGGAEGTVTYEWMEGGFFLIQRFDLTHEGHEVKGVEIIGHLQPFGEESEPELKSRAYDNVGNTLDYVYEMDGETLFIWAGAKGSPAYFKGQFSHDGNTNTGEWFYPGGGGYESTMTRVRA